MLISVADDGVGLPAEDRARLTEPYVTHKPKGTGLGLAIVKKIMEDHGGRVLLEDRPDGRPDGHPEGCQSGAIATLVLPLTVAERARRATSAVARRCRARLCRKVPDGA